MQFGRCAGCVQLRFVVAAVDCAMLVTCIPTARHLNIDDVNICVTLGFDVDVVNSCIIQVQEIEAGTNERPVTKGRRTVAGMDETRENTEWTA